MKFLNWWSPPSRAVTAPVTVSFAITDACNMRCPMCMASWRMRKSRESSEVKVDPAFFFSNVLRPLKESGASFLSLNGGEPTLSPHLLEVMRGARALGYGIFLATNALSEKVNSFENILNEMESSSSAIQVSFDSFKEEEFNLIRGGNYYSIVHGNILKIRDLIDKNNHQVKLVANIVVQENNAESFLQTIDYALSVLRVHRVLVGLRHDYEEVTCDNWKNQKPLVVTDSARGIILKNAKILFDIQHENKRVGVCGADAGDWEALLTRPRDIKQKCGSAKRIFVDAEGNLRGCIYSPVIANLREVNIKTFLRSKAYKDFLVFSEYCNICIHGCAK